MTVYERNRLDDTFGFGVVFSDATKQALAQADPEVTAAMAAHSHRWDDIEIHYRGQLLSSTGHGFSGLSRRTLLSILADRCREMGVRLCFEREIQDPEEVRDADLVLAADGVNSMVRERYQNHFRPTAERSPTSSCGSAPRGRSARSRSSSATTGTGCGACTPTSTSRAHRRSSSRRARRPGARPASIAPPRPTRWSSARSCSPPSWRAIG